MSDPVIAHLEPNDPPTPRPESVGSVPALIVRLWPKIPVLYPAALVALLCGILQMWHLHENPTEMLQHGAVSPLEQALGITFLGTLMLCLFTITFDIGLTWALLWIAGVVIIGLVLVLVNIFYPFLPEFFSWLKHLQPYASTQFYYCVFAIWVILMIVGIIYVRFHYVRFESNEIIVVGGILDKRRRYSTAGFTYTKEVTDVFEHYLPFVRSGRLIMRFPNEEEPLMLDNVMDIDGVIKRLEMLTSVMAVQGSQGKAQ